MERKEPLFLMTAGEPRKESALGRKNSYYRLRNLLRQDLALIEAAICNKEHKLEEGRE
ncbi:hypothetical protein CC1G_11946 [Coprinopsis cinerea okayama7|uniref:Uncharacterized protein n=1 Tax=Coprinopsis cinerea (strain Okayama-7 / 130 / ATCC MYA-4618 / FGSC 9003) TaxID=240176 RepID=A8PHH5_COPC7|nr:hypothetical protein CC1G_11946 [Coprinopsis cinerea okayama7\|eukprot:XP_001841403.2 hypothetical protein CC1G_11946 [Coprinopsis cinerea okayama7\